MGFGGSCDGGSGLYGGRLVLCGGGGGSGGDGSVLHLLKVVIFGMGMGM